MADRETSTREHPVALFCEAVSDLLDQQATAYDDARVVA